MTKIGFGVSTGLEIDAELEMVGVDDEPELELELELAGVGVGAALIAVEVTSWVMVGPGLTTSTVLVALMMVVACAGWFPPSTLMTE